ncbi:transcription termination/antitermination protein NusG [Nonomuraea sp. NPDC049269]|uniref:transcription termination/antitermination protein NusG n=1 Tax=Nonomuraea sp. NPDC049269 TaxID=3364349 RepID=UPI0037101B4F
MADMLVLGEPDDAPTIPPETVPSTFAVGDAVMLADGPFASLPGTVRGIDVDGRMLTVALSIFGRDHDIEVPFHQVGKL